MKFEMNVETDYLTVKFSYGATFPALEVIWKTFERLGGKPQEYLDEWTFPTFITSQVLEEVIHNTCFVCGGLMKDEEYHPDHILRKCNTCGHSHT